MKYSVISSKFSSFVFRYASRVRNTRYHFRHAPWLDLLRFENLRTGKKNLPWLELLKASWRHGASFEDFYLLRFDQKSRSERRNYLTQSLYYEMERQVNRLDRAMILRDKLLFKSHFQDLLGRQVWSWQEILKFSPETRPPEHVVIKHRLGVKGQDIHFPEQRFQTWQELLRFIQVIGEPEHYLCEARIQQHAEMARLNPGTVNTFRVMTYVDASEVQIWGVILRVGAGTGPDNWAQGGIVVWVEPGGEIRKQAVLKNPFLPRLNKHPKTQVSLQGFQIPFYQQIKDLAIESAKRLPEVRTVGWDIALKPEGPCLIEGNDRWSHQFLQVTQGTGVGHLADAVCEMYQVYE